MFDRSTTGPTTIYLKVNDGNKKHLVQTVKLDITCTNDKLKIDCSNAPGSPSKNS